MNDDVRAAIESLRDWLKDAHGYLADLNVLTDRLAAVEKELRGHGHEQCVAKVDVDAARAADHRGFDEVRQFLNTQLAEATRQRESYERASLVLIQQLADRDRKLEALEKCSDEPCNSCIACLRHALEITGGKLAEARRDMLHEANRVLCGGLSSVLDLEYMRDLCIRVACADRDRALAALRELVHDLATGDADKRYWAIRAAAILALPAPEAPTPQGGQAISWEDARRIAEDGP